MRVITTASDPGPRFLDPDTGHVYDDLGNVYPNVGRRVVKFDALYGASALRPQCHVPPDGWACSREAGHDGPCAASPDNFWTAIWSFLKESW